MKLSKFFRTAGKWTQNAMARNINGELINFHAYNLSLGEDRETRVESLSLQGALAYFYSQEKEPERREKEIRKLKSAIERYTGRNLYVAEFNNSPQTTFQDVRNVLDIYEKLK